jgi:hypothetical protein
MGYVGDMCVRELEICNRAWGYHDFHRILMRPFPEVATPQITADHLPECNLGFFSRPRRNKNRIRHFTSSEYILRINKNKKINATSIKICCNTRSILRFEFLVEIFMCNIFEK